MDVAIVGGSGSLGKAVSKVLGELGIGVDEDIKIKNYAHKDQFRTGPSNRTYTHVVKHCPARLAKAKDKRLRKQQKRLDDIYSRSFMQRCKYLVEADHLKWEMNR